jgi:hypothetical protein
VGRILTHTQSTEQVTEFTEIGAEPVPVSTERMFTPKHMGWFDVGIVRKQQTAFVLQAVQSPIIGIVVQVPEDFLINCRVRIAALEQVCHDLCRGRIQIDEQEDEQISAIDLYVAWQIKKLALRFEEVILECGMEIAGAVPALTIVAGRKPCERAQLHQRLFAFLSLPQPLPQVPEDDADRPNQLVRGRSGGERPNTLGNGIESREVRNAKPAIKITNRGFVAFSEFGERDCIPKHDPHHIVIKVNFAGTAKMTVYTFNEWDLG